MYNGIFIHNSKQQNSSVRIHHFMLQKTCVFLNRFKNTGTIPKAMKHFQETRKDRIHAQTTREKAIIFN